MLQRTLFFAAIIVAMICAAPGWNSGYARAADELEARLHAIPEACARGGVPSLREAVSQTQKLVRARAASLGEKGVQSEIEKEQDEDRDTWISALTEVAPDALPKAFPARKLFLECAAKMSAAIEHPSSESTEELQTCLESAYFGEPPETSKAILSCLKLKAGAAKK